jgi:hypothetical protein
LDTLAVHTSLLRQGHRACPASPWRIITLNHCSVEAGEGADSIYYIHGTGQPTMHFGSSHSTGESSDPREFVSLFFRFFSLSSLPPWQRWEDRTVLGSPGTTTASSTLPPSAGLSREILAGGWLSPKWLPPFLEVYKPGQRTLLAGIHVRTIVLTSLTLGLLARRSRSHMACGMNATPSAHSFSRHMCALHTMSSPMSRWLLRFTRILNACDVLRCLNCSATCGNHDPW